LSGTGFDQKADRLRGKTTDEDPRHTPHLPIEAAGVEWHFVILHLVLRRDPVAAGRQRHVFLSITLPAVANFRELHRGIGVALRISGTEAAPSRGLAFSFRLRPR
jgi:hypothetical protein